MSDSEQAVTEAPATEQKDLFLTEKEARRLKETPLMRQYWKIKDRHTGALLLFRMGDFYETFEQDAVIVADVLGLTLTRRANGQAADVPLAGFPYHALDQYLPKLVQAGYRVAICEQLEDPKKARKIVKRGVVEVVTPGVAFQDQLLAPKHAHYLAAVTWGKNGRKQSVVGFSFADASTGEFFVTEVPEAQFPALLQSVSPAEVIVDRNEKSRLAPLGSFAITEQEDWVFGHDFAYETLLRHFQTHSLKGFGVEELSVGLTAAGAALYYLGETQKGRLPHIRRLRKYTQDAYLSLDPATQRNLELVASKNDRGRDGSLIQILDVTRTPMGGRWLRAWLVRPLRDVAQINRRLDAVEALFKSATMRDAVRNELRGVGDLERLAGKICTGRASPRDLVALKQTLQRIPQIKKILSEEKGGVLAQICERLNPCQAMVSQIADVLVDEPPAKMDAGGYIRDGFSDELDELRSIAHSGKEYLAKLREEETARTGITSLKIGYNRVFGYYLEVTNAHRDKVPDDYIRKQTLVNAERYITPALKEYEEKILTAEEKLVTIERELFESLREAVGEDIEPAQENARLLAQLDVFASFAEVADRNAYVRPHIDESKKLEIVAGRHPVVEEALPAGEPFIPNSISIAAPGDSEDEARRLGQIHVITGPNMAGKSVALRQTGLIVLLAQVGSFVPAKSAHIGVVDAIFTRVGASDNLAAGESTFLVEMNETANILNNASARSLILLDEVGRGTSTFDGLSIAWAIVEHLHENQHVAARTLFATHYHELNALAERLERVKNFRVQVQEHDGRVIFLRTLIPGGADHSYGIEVARMAGLPKEVVRRAKEVLAHLETHDVAGEVGLGPAPSVSSAADAEEAEVEAQRTKELLEMLRDLDPEHMTPIEALAVLARLRGLADA
ncbi:MAG: DNA mismatch repair protein MutS [Rubricoccaceae bacterium]|nr:DNA mismatch repair protein MutS [Rubricoccaceae bacterium]